jgi:3-oxoacyl-[acyl-carrier protein] reductase
LVRLEAEGRIVRVQIVGDVVDLASLHDDPAISKPVRHSCRTYEGDPMNDKKSKIAVVTGASRAIGIGAAIARTLAAAGHDVFITYYRPYDATMPWGEEATAPAALLAELQGIGVRTAGMEIDLSDPTAAPRLLDAVEDALGPASILVNNATYSTNGGIDELTAEQLDRHYAVNLRGMALLCAEFVRRFQGGEGGRIINMTSGQGVGPMADELAYAATKGAVEAFTVSLSAGVAARGITVNAVDPGATDTGWMSAELRSQLAAESPIGRVGLPEDAARLVRFLASEEAGWITGQVIHSRGGG